MTGQWVVLEPLDTVTVRDGRSFDMGLDATARLALPSPATFAGAIGALYDPTPGLARTKRDARGQELPSRIHGPITVEKDGEQWEALFPVPHDVLIAADDTYGERGEPRRLVLSRPPVGIRHDAAGQVEFLLADPPGGGEPAGDRWWDAEQLQGYLHDGDLDRNWRADPWQLERRVGIARGEDRTVAESMFYSIEHIRPKPGVGFAGNCLGGPDRRLSGTIPFGGRGRRAEVHGNQPAVRLPGRPEEFPGGRLLLYVATPAVFPGGSWVPDLSDWPEECGEPKLAAAAVAAPRVITTGSPDRRTGAFTAGRLMWAVPPGAVYYLQFEDEAAAAAAAVAVDGTTLRQAEDWMTTAGFGLVFTGRWTEG